MKKIKTLIIPDVHCRDFWKDAVNDVLKNYPNAKILFLGDYLDGYPFEWSRGFDYKTHGIENFKEIIELKKKHPDRIILLQGNHDQSYSIGTSICDCRRDKAHYKEIEKLFDDNRSLFQLAYEENVGGKRFIYSHAGILRKYIEDYCKDMGITDENVVEKLNEAWKNDDPFLENLGVYDHYRGWGGTKYASPVWSDIRSWYDLKPEDTYGFNIVGHTMCTVPIVFDTIANLDCQEAFYLDDEGKIRFYKDDKEVEKYKEKEK